MHLPGIELRPVVPLILLALLEDRADICFFFFFFQSSGFSQSLGYFEHPTIHVL